MNEKQLRIYKIISLVLNINLSICIIFVMCGWLYISAIILSIVTLFILPFYIYYRKKYKHYISIVEDEQIRVEARNEMLQKDNISENKEFKNKSNKIVLGSKKEEK